MRQPQETTRTGFDHVQAAAALLRRARLAHPTKCLFDTAELEWFWTNPRSTDSLDQLFWYDERDEPVAAAILTDWGDGTSLVYNSVTLTPLVLPDASSDWGLHVLARGLEHAAAHEIAEVELEVDVDDAVTREYLFDRGFVVGEGGLIGCWMDADARPEVSPLADGYRLCSRDQLTHREHHLARPTRPDFEERLAQASCYRQDLDLVVLAEDDAYAGHGMFWFDDVTKVGLVEPMRTDDDHQQRGLARHILTSGIERLADLGAERINIGYEPDNPASGHLYRSVGFIPEWQSEMIFGPTAATGELLNR